MTRKIIRSSPLNQIRESTKITIETIESDSLFEDKNQPIVQRQQASNDR